MRKGTVLFLFLAVCGHVAGAQAQWNTGTSGALYYSGGNVGVRTSGPVSGLHVFAAFPGDGMRVEGAAGNSPAFLLSGNPYGGALGLTLSAGHYSTDATPGDLVLRVADRRIIFSTVSNGNYPAKMAIDALGNVGIGTATPSARLDVQGDVNITGTLVSKYQDLAEWVPASSTIEAGMVVVLDSNARNSVTPSDIAYDTKVAGVVSARPGITLGEASPSKVLVATTGRVRVRAIANESPIRVGDLLVTSDVPGVAMRSEPMEIRGRKFHQPGTIIGKALEPLSSGRGEILVLLSLQ
jgi:hypothetical protein